MRVFALVRSDAAVWALSTSLPRSRRRSSRALSVLPFDATSSRLPRIRRENLGSTRSPSSTTSRLAPARKPCSSCWFNKRPLERSGTSVAQKQDRSACLQTSPQLRRSRSHKLRQPCWITSRKTRRVASSATGNARHVRATWRRALELAAETRFFAEVWADLPRFVQATNLGKLHLPAPPTQLNSTDINNLAGVA